MNDPSQEGETAETETINVVPLADLTLVLLIILMVLSPMISQSMIHVATPKVTADKELTQEDPDQKPPEPLMIAVTTKGYSLNNVPAEGLPQLADALRARLEEDRARPVIVTADDVIPVGMVVEILDMAKQNGAEKVSLLKRAETSPEGAKT